MHPLILVRLIFLCHLPDCTSFAYASIRGMGMAHHPRMVLAMNEALVH